MSRSIGNFWNNKEKKRTNVLQTTLGNQDYSKRLSVWL